MNCFFEVPFIYDHVFCLFYINNLKSLIITFIIFVIFQVLMKLDCNYSGGDWEDVVWKKEGHKYKINQFVNHQKLHSYMVLV